MTGLDWIIVAFAAILAAFGFRRGFIVGALSFGGFALGAFLGTRLAPLLLSQGSSSPYAPVFGLGGAVLVGAIFASGAEGLGFVLRRSLLLPGLGVLDGVLGAALGAALALGVIWIVAAVAKLVGTTGSFAIVRTAFSVRSWNCAARRMVYGTPESSMARSAAAFMRSHRTGTLSAPITEM